MRAGETFRGPAGQTFYTKSMTVELDKERRARRKIEGTAATMRHALKVRLFPTTKSYK
jgi:hypothetical protein